MSTKTPATISAISTIVILVFLAIAFLLLQMVALNGVTEEQGFTAMGVSLACQGIMMIVLGVLAARATTFLITKVEWNAILAVVVTVLLATIVGGVIAFLSSFISIAAAGIR